MGKKRYRKKASKSEALLYSFFKIIIVIILFLSFTAEVLSSLLSFFISLNLLEWVYVFITIGSLYFLYTLAKQQEKRKIEERRYYKQIQLEEYKKKSLQRIKEKNSLELLRKMDPFEFEHFIKEIFELKGYMAIVTPRSNDGGKDIILSLGEEKCIVECKRFNSPKVTRPHIQKFHSAIIDTKSVKGYFVTTGEFTKPAVTYCEDKPIYLINGEELVKMVILILEEIDYKGTPHLSFNLNPN